MSEDLDKGRLVGVNPIYLDPRSAIEGDLPREELCTHSARDFGANDRLGFAWLPRVTCAVRHALLVCTRRTINERPRADCNLRDQPSSLSCRHSCSGTPLDRRKTGPFRLRRLGDQTRRRAAAWLPTLGRRCRRRRLLSLLPALVGSEPSCGAFGTQAHGIHLPVLGVDYSSLSPAELGLLTWRGRRR